MVKKADTTAMLIKCLTIFIGVVIVIVIAENLGVRGWPEALLGGAAATGFALLSQPIQKLVHPKTK